MVSLQGTTTWLCRITQQESEITWRNENDVDHCRIFLLSSFISIILLASKTSDFSDFGEMQSLGEMGNKLSDIFLISTSKLLIKGVGDD